MADRLDMLRFICRFCCYGTPESGCWLGFILFFHKRMIESPKALGTAAGKGGAWNCQDEKRDTPDPPSKDSIPGYLASAIVHNNQNAGKPGENGEADA